MGVLAKFEKGGTGTIGSLEKIRGVRKPQPTMICVIKPEFPLLVTVAFA